MDPHDRSLIDQIEAVRRQNNSRWMDLVRLALESAPIRARQIFAQISTHDAEILNLSKQLATGRASFPPSPPAIGNCQPGEIEHLDP